MSICNISDLSDHFLLCQGLLSNILVLFFLQVCNFGFCYAFPSLPQHLASLFVFCRNLGSHLIPTVFCSLNPFVPNAPFFYPLKTSENRKVFWCFQGGEKGCLGNKWVKRPCFVNSFVINGITNDIIPVP